VNDTTAARLQLKLFGPPTLAQHGQVLRPALKRSHGMFAFLALEARSVPREVLAELLWPDVDAAVGRTRLRRLIYQIEKQCGGALMASHDGGLVLAVDALWCDAVEFRRAARALVAKSAPGLPFAALVRLTHSACQPLLEGLSFGSDMFDEWVQAQRLEHAHLLSRMLTRLAEQQRERGDVDDAVDTVERRLRLDPYSEPAYVQRMSLAAEARDATTVEATFIRCADALRHEFGCKPSRATEAAYLALREQAQSPPAAAREDRPTLARVAAALDIRFASSSGGAVAYATLGRGRETIVVMPGFVSHIEIAWEHEGLRHLLERLAERHTVVVFDRRGVGLSERLTQAGTVEAAAADVRSILDAAGIERAWLFGSSEGGPAAITLAVSSPSRVSGLVLFGSMAKGSRADDYPWALKREAFDRWMERLVRGWGGPADIETFSPPDKDDAASRAWWSRMLRHAASPASLRMVLEGLRDADVRALLQRVRQPTLVLHRRGDRAVRFEAGEHLATHIAGARFVALEGTSHWWWAEDSDRVLAELTAFVEAPRVAKLA